MNLTTTRSGFLSRRAALGYRLDAGRAEAPDRPERKH